MPVIAPAERQVVRRDGTTAPYDRDKITAAMTKAFLSVEGAGADASARVHEQVETLAAAAEASLFRHGDALHIEDIQDQVELALMRAGQHKVARAYVLYRDEHARARIKPTGVEPLLVAGPDGALVALDEDRLRAVIEEACAGLSEVSADAVLVEARRGLYRGIDATTLNLALIMAARALVESEPEYSSVAARLLLHQLRGEADGMLGTADNSYPDYFRNYLRHGIELELIDPELARFDVDRIASALLPDRDLNFDFLGLQTLYDRYLLHSRGVRFELPQAFFMRVAMGLAVREVDREERAIEFYRLLSSFDFMASTPTLFNSGTLRAQLSSCFLTTIPDDLDAIFSGIKNNALLSKYAGGLGNDWTRVRGLGAHIKGTNGESQGVVPFLKIANDTAVAVNQGGKRKGAVCAYLETWHIDIEQFLDLRKNTGDDRRRTHDMNTANWVPDLFMQRVAADGDWTLFSPDEVADLHELYGPEFAARYIEYERLADAGQIAVFRRIRAVELWRKMLTMLVETGHPWLTFKDPCNIRSPQRHAGVVHSSNLCTEITLNTADDQVAVCNLGSVNLAQHVGPDGLDREHLARTVRTAVRMLDNVIDINFYAIPEARRSNLRHRPIGLGLMGFQDALFTMRIPMASAAAVEFADSSMEELSFHAISASVELAAERGRYPSFDGSLWSQGVLPIDSLDLLAAAREGDLEVDRGTRLDWSALRERVRSIGMRNSNVMAIAPTATISNICGVGQSIEPLFRNLYVKSNMSGDFTVTNAFLVRDLKQRGLWDEVMVSDLKYFDGSLGQIGRIPQELKALYATAFEIEPTCLVEAAARRQKWIDQAQSLNLYVAQPSGCALDELYRLAWRRGCKTTYYLRAQSATHVEKSTLRGTDGKLNAVAPVAAVSPVDTAAPVPTGAACSIDDPDCEACE